MDARDQLRRFLEQRREAGETELVFDQLSVDEAMRILGAGAPKETGGRRQEAGKERNVEILRARRLLPSGPSVLPCFLPPASCLLAVHHPRYLSSTEGTVRTRMPRSTQTPCSRM